MHSNVFLRATFTILSGVFKDNDGRLHFWGQKERCLYIPRAGYCQAELTETTHAGHTEMQCGRYPRGGLGTSRGHRLIMWNGNFVHLS